MLGRKQLAFFVTFHDTSKGVGGVVCIVVTRNKCTPQRGAYVCVCLCVWVCALAFVRVACFSLGCFPWHCACKLPAASKMCLFVVVCLVSLLPNRLWLGVLHASVFLFGLQPFFLLFLSLSVSFLVFSRSYWHSYFAFRFILLRSNLERRASCCERCKQWLSIDMVMYCAI